jgi:hypothetical protein
MGQRSNRSQKKRIEDAVVSTRDKPDEDWDIGVSRRLAKGLGVLNSACGG